MAPILKSPKHPSATPRLLTTTILYLSYPYTCFLWNTHKNLQLFYLLRLDINFTTGNEVRDDVLFTAGSPGMVLSM